MQLIRIKSCAYVEPKRISSELKHSLSNKETSPQKKKLKFLKEYLRNIKNTNKKRFYRNSFRHTREDTEIPGSGDLKAGVVKYHL